MKVITRALNRLSAKVNRNPTLNVYSCSLSRMLVPFYSSELTINTPSVKLGKRSKRGRRIYSEAGIDVTKL